MREREGLSPADGLRIAKLVFTDRYQSAQFAIAAGSIIRGQGTYLSDIDLVVVYTRLEAARRESFIFDGVPVEAFVHDFETLNWFVDGDVERGRPSILNMIVEGSVIGPDKERAKVLRKASSRRLKEGPPSLSKTALNSLRYEITDAIDDLRGERLADEVIAIGAMLHPKLVELALRGRGLWYGTGKWAPRLLDDAETELRRQFENAFSILFQAIDPTALIVMAEAELARHGGPLFDGDCRTAPKTWRISES